MSFVLTIIYAMKMKCYFEEKRMVNMWTIYMRAQQNIFNYQLYFKYYRTSTKSIFAHKTKQNGKRHPQD